jgi:hypothetical protein
MKAQVGLCKFASHFKVGSITLIWLELWRGGEHIRCRATSRTARARGSAKCKFTDVVGSLEWAAVRQGVKNGLTGANLEGMVADSTHANGMPQRSTRSNVAVPPTHGLPQVTSCGRWGF